MKIKKMFSIVMAMVLGITCTTISVSAECIPLHSKLKQ